jgi:hypothetical protein
MLWNNSSGIWWVCIKISLLRPPRLMMLSQIGDLSGRTGRAITGMGTGVDVTVAMLIPMPRKMQKVMIVTVIVLVIQLLSPEMVPEAIV